jgi:hypothetical protein
MIIIIHENFVLEFEGIFAFLGSGLLTKLNFEIDFKQFKGLILKGKVYYCA